MEYSRGFNSLNDGGGKGCTGASDTSRTRMWKKCAYVLVLQGLFKKSRVRLKLYL